MRAEIDAAQARQRARKSEVGRNADLRCSAMMGDGHES